MKVLIIEDEPKTVTFLKKGFTEEGYIAEVAQDGVDGLHMATTGSYDVVVLDIQLPRQDGWAVLQEIRKRDQHQPVIILTALDSVAHRVKGLELGADDYLVKPFAFSELNARARNVLRRGQIRPAEILQFADLKMDLLRHKVFRAESEIDLAPQEYRLLEFFLRHASQVLTRTRIAEQVWDINFDGDSNVVDAAVRRVRRKVDDPFDLKLIHTIRGVGYVLEVRN
ncbi:MAG: heavy metal response regulator transcription factor [Gammaproteobacteria bacterium]|nr:heavy metal response regulator transcription factor [Gammaproteobacteria bacterium]